MTLLDTNKCNRILDELVDSLNKDNKPTLIELQFILGSLLYTIGRSLKGKSELTDEDRAIIFLNKTETLADWFIGTGHLLLKFMEGHIKYAEEKKGTEAATTGNGGITEPSNTQHNIESHSSNEEETS